MSSTGRFLGLAAGWMLAAFLAVHSPAQTPEGKPAASATETPAKPSPPAQPPTAKEARVVQLAADTEKLYQLAQELKVELDKTTKDTLSLSVVKKATEIERLAHSISARMKSN